jgi:(p)ppGpp synthase/HD superfamily hydrolase
MVDGRQTTEASPLLSQALELACASHEGPRYVEGAGVEHPRAVAKLLQEEGFDDEVVAAGLLHDVIETSTTGLDEIEERFGAEVRDLVAAMTEDGTIRSYPLRKAEHRDRAGGDRRVAAIYAADKLAKVRDAGPGDPIPAPKLEHYRETLRVLSTDHPSLPFLNELREELERRDETELVSPGDD